MKPKNQLYLQEEILLLGLRDDAGTLESGGACDVAIGGVTIAELLLHERIRVGEGRKKLVDVIDRTPIGNVFLDDALTRMVEAKRPASVSTWVAKLGSSRQRQPIAERLCEMGILRAEERKILGIFKRTVFPENNPEPERELRDRIRQAVVSDQHDLDARTAVLVAVAHHAHLLRPVLGKEILKARRDRLASIADGQVAGRATQEVIAAAQMAIMVATTVATTTIVTSS